MKKIIAAILMLTLLFFTFFSESIYVATKPKVTLLQVSMVHWEGKKGYVVPKSAVYPGNIVYTVEERDGFMEDQLFAKACVVEVEAYNKEELLVKAGLSKGQVVITSTDREIIPNKVVLRR